MKKLILVCLLALLGCEVKHTTDEALGVCHKVCESRPIDDFSFNDDFNEYHVECRCGELKIKCEGSSCLQSGH